jgi:hypothetical protein
MSQRAPSHHHTIENRTIKSALEVRWDLDESVDYWGYCRPRRTKELVRFIEDLHLQVDDTAFAALVQDAYQQETLRRKRNRDTLTKFLKQVESVL